ncbi:MAG: hypothetical protein QM758_13830 [Armatimonas sp.]
MARFRVYTTFAEGELDKELKKLSLKTCVVTDAPEGWQAKRRYLPGW